VIETAIVGAVESVALALVLVLPPAVAPNSISCLLSQHTRLGLCDIDGEPECLCFRATRTAARKVVRPALLAAALVAAELIVLPHRAETWAAMAYLVVTGSVLVFLLYLVVLRYWTASWASYGFVIIPFVTLVLSAGLDNEPVGVGLVLGGLLVLAGVISARSAPPESLQQP